MENEDTLRLKLDKLQNKFDQYKTQTDQYEQYLQSQLKQKQSALAHSSQQYEKVLQQYQSLRAKYTRNQAEVASLQTEKQALKQQLQVFNQQKRDLQTMNDQWEQSTRILEFSKQDLQDKLYQAQQSAIMYKQQLDELNTLRAIEVQRLKQECNNLRQEIQSLSQLQANSAKIQELEQALAKSLKESEEVKSKLRASQVGIKEENGEKLEEHAIKVLARIRPVLPGESGQIGVKVRNNQIAVLMPKRGRQTPAESKKFQFQTVLGPESQESDVFMNISDSLNCVLRGGRACILAYGQTGSGKTHTMNSIIHLSLQYLFNSLNNYRDVRMNCIQIYNQNARDLLGEEKPKKNWKQVVLNAEIKLGKNWFEEALAAIQTAGENRITKFTQSNQRSSRSHSIFTVTLNFGEKTGQIQFVDLAGSQRIQKSGAKGDVLKQTLLINKSLSALQDVIAALETKQQHVPYRNSLLTQVLQSTLGGSQSYVTVILNCNALLSNIGESVCTLALGTRLKSVDLTFNLRNSLKNQEVQRTLSLLQKERSQKQGLSRKIDKLQRDIQSYTYALKERENKINSLSQRHAKKEKEFSDQLDKVRKELAMMKNKYEEVNKKFRILGVQAENQRQAKTKVLKQLQSKEEQMKRVLSSSPSYDRRPPSAPPSNVHIQHKAMTPTRIPQLFSFKLEPPYPFR